MCSKSGGAFLSTRGAVMELVILLVALVAVLVACVGALRLLALEFDRDLGACANGAERVHRIRRELVEL